MTTTQERGTADAGTVGGAQGRAGRRGIIAGAAALAAGLLAREALAPERVAATDHFALVVADVNTTTMQTELSGTYTASLGAPMFFVSNSSTTGSGISGSANGSGYGVSGQSASGNGIAGMTNSISSTSFAGVRGDGPATGVSGAASNVGVGGAATYGVFGVNNGTTSSNFGVYGNAGLGGIGVGAFASNNDGVNGTTNGQASAGVRGGGPKTGVAGAATNTGVPVGTDTYGVYGSNGGSASNRYGAYGTSNGVGVGGVGTGNGSVGVSGTSTPGTGVTGTSTSGIGVSGTSTGNAGVTGTSSNTVSALVAGVNGLGPLYGVVGIATGQGVTGTGGSFGVTGLAIGGANSYGVVGGVLGNGVLGNGVMGSGIVGGIGVRGSSDTGYAIYGQTSAAAGVTSGTAVYGTSASGIGVYGISGGGGSPFGVVGNVTSAPGFGLYGVASVAGTVGFNAGALAGAIAGQFSGPVNLYNTVVNNQVVAPGNLFVQGNLPVQGNKNAAVPHPDGTHRLLYCMESPEAWFEDFGEGTITGGKAEVRLDPDFAAVVDTRVLHVFPVPHDAHHALHVAGRSATGFTVGAVPSTTGAAAGKAPAT